MSALPLRCPGRRSGRRSEVEPPEHPSRNGAGQAGEDGGVIRGDHEAHDSDAIIVKALMSSNLLCLLSGSNSYLQQLKRTMNLQVTSVHIIPKNFDGQVMTGLTPVEDINQLYDHYIESVLNVFKIPQKIKTGGMERNQEISLNARIFQGEIQVLCRHLNNFCENVYNIIYGGEKDDVQFLIAPNPKLSIESMEDIKTLFEVGSISPHLAKKFREVFIESDKSLLSLEDGISNRFNNSKNPGNNDDNFNHGKYGNKNANGFSAKEKNDTRVMKTELQYFKPDKAKPASYHPPLEKDKNKSKK